MPIKVISVKGLPIKEYNRIYRENNKESFKIRHARYYLNSIESNITRMKEYREQTKRQVLKYYGGGFLSCVCCGEHNIGFLSLDHINNDGYINRKTGSHPNGGIAMYAWLRHNGFPKGYRTLCFNCNCGRSRTKDKICPHIKQKENNSWETEL